jgi:hypothetical protein
MYRETQSEPDDEEWSHGKFVASIAQFLRPKLYIELGCRLGETFAQVEPYCENAVAIDCVNHEEWLRAKGLQECFVQSDTIEYMNAQEDESVDLCFLDSSHEEEATVLEFDAIAPKMRKNGVVLFHDTYPPNEQCTASDRCGGVWRAIERIKAKHSCSFEFATFPAQYGITVARKNLGRQLLWR